MKPSKIKLIDNNKNEAIAPCVSEVIFSHTQIMNAISLAAEWVNKKISHMKGPCVLVGVLKGCVPFVGSILPLIRGDVILDFFGISSYRSGIKQESPKIILDMANDVAGKDIIILEDVVDTGNTLEFLMDLLQKRKAKSISLVTLFTKPGAKRRKLKIDFVGLELPNKWMVGFGLDCNEQWRNLPYVGVLKTAYQKKK